MKQSKFNNKVLTFMIGLNNAYGNEDQREEQPKLELKEEELTEDFTAMLMALNLFYDRITSDTTDLIGFTHILNRLAIQHVTEPKNGYMEEEEHE